MSKVELIYDKDCPNVSTARANLMKSFAQFGHTPKWTEWDRGSSDSPDYAGKYGSPSILVDGRDVDGSGPGEGNASCRIYLDSTESNKHVPSIEMIVAALSRASRHPNRCKAAGIFGGLAVGPSAAAAFLAKAACPLCYPAIASLFSSLGLGFLFKGTYFAILATFLLGLVLFGLGFRANTRRGYGPFVLGFISSAVVIAAKLIWDEDVALYSGIGGLIVASAWNLVPKKNLNADSCPSCVTDGADFHGA